MPIYYVKLKRREEVAEGTMAFYFERPEGFNFKPGQHIDMILINPPETDEEGNIRTFSIASAPFEEILMITTRMRDTAFKRVLKVMPLEGQVQIKGPLGSFTLHKDATRPAVLLAGGIGITPFLSILRQATHDKLPHRLLLFSSNRRPEDAAFLQELQELEKVNPNYKFVGTMTKMEKSNKPWQGKTGYINREMLAEYIEDFSKPIYYIAGPERVVVALRTILDEAGIYEDNIRTEEFAGY